MIDPLAALGLAGNVLQLIDFSFKLVSEGNKLYRSASGTLEENKAAEDLANDLSSLTTGVSQLQNKWIEAHGNASLEPDEIQLRNICDRCTEIATELNLQLQKLKIEDGAKHRKLKSYKQALVLVWRKDAIDQVANRLEKYRQELNTQVLFGLRKSAEQADVKSSTQFAALDQQTKDLTLAVLDADKKFDTQAEVLAKIHQNTSQILSTIETERKRSPSPLPVYEAVPGGGGGETTPLHQAAEAGDALKIRQLLRSSQIDVNARDKYGCTPLHCARTGDVAKRLLSDRRIEKNAEDDEGRSALHCAVLKRRLDVVKSLLEAGVDKTLEDDRGRAAAFYARVCATAAWLLKHGPETEARAEDHLHNTGLLQLAWLDDLEGTEFFVRHGADVNAKNDWNETALTEAARHGSSRIVQTLISHGANIEHPADGEWTPLLQGVRDGRTEVVQILLQHGANKEAPLKNGNTSLAEAGVRFHFNIARMLIEAGSSIETLDSTRCTPLLRAAFKGDEAMVRWLLNRGASKEARDKNGSNAVFFATATAIVSGQTNTLKTLLEFGISVDTKGNNNYTSVSLAAQQGDYDCVKLLLDAGADPNLHGANGSGYTALAEASHHGRADVVKLLLDHGAKWEIGSNSGFSAVSVAAHNSRRAIIRILAEHGANLDQPGFSHKNRDLSVTPIMRAAMKGDHQTVDVLAELGANLDARDAIGRTALIIAASKNHEQCVSVLIQRGASVNLQSDKEETALMMAAGTGSQAIARMLMNANATRQLRDWRGSTAWHYAVCTAHNEELKDLLQPEYDEQEYLHPLQAEHHPSEIAAYLNEVCH